MGACLGLFGADWGVLGLGVGESPLKGARIKPVN